MNAPLSKSSESTNWLHLYRAAILEMDPSKLSQHVAEAENQPSITRTPSRMIVSRWMPVMRSIDRMLEPSASALITATC